MRARAGCRGFVVGERRLQTKGAPYLNRHFSNVVAVDFSASSRECQLDGINASKKLVSLINKNTFDFILPRF